MCGRFALKTKPANLAKKFNASVLETFNEHYNIAPTARIPVIQVDPDKKERVIKRDYWGLIPYWAKNTNIAYHTSNARAESVGEKPSFKRAFQKMRCLVIADGFYEWDRSMKPSQPYYFSMKDGEPFAMAGLYESWKARWVEDDREETEAGKKPKPTKPVSWPLNLGGKEYNQGDVLESCTIITTRPNVLMAKIHDRMPVILDPKNYDAWLDPEFKDENFLKALLIPCPATKLNCWPVDRIINKVGEDDTENCIKEVKAHP